MTDLPGRIARGESLTLRENRRTTVITIDGESLIVCEIPCRNDFLQSCNVPGQVSRAVYRSTGKGTIFVGWSGLTHTITWRRLPPSARFCDQCGDEWRHTIPDGVRAAIARSEAGKAKWAALTDAERAEHVARLAATPAASPVDLVESPR